MGEKLESEGTSGEMRRGKWGEGKSGEGTGEVGKKKARIERNNGKTLGGVRDQLTTSIDQDFPHTDAGAGGEHHQSCGTCFTCRS
jgi:hypothetical protein